MTNATRVLLLIAGLALGLGACTSRVQVVHRTPSTEPTPAQPTEPAPTQPTEPAPTTGVPVDVTIASVTLGEDCPPPVTSAPAAQPPAASLRASSDAPAAGAPALDSLVDSRHGGGYCPGTGLQLSITAPAHHPGGALEVVAVRLLSMESAPLGTLEVRGRTLFEDGQYIAWDGTVAPGRQNVSLHLSGPDWGTFGGDRRGYGQSYRIEVDVRVGGETRTIAMGPVSREPMVVT